jgi:deoxyribonuclease V
MRKNTLRLRARPNSFYENLYEESSLKLAELGGGGKAACIYLATDEGDICLQFPIEFGDLRTDLLPVGREVLSQIVEMDDAVRAANADETEFDDDEVLTRVIVREFFVAFEYTASPWNSSWFEYFTRDGSGHWIHRRMRLPWMADWRTKLKPQRSPSAIVALDAAYGDTASAAAGVLFSDWSDKDVLGTFAIRTDKPPPAYQPGEFYKRELPALMALLDTSANPISEIVIDGYAWLSGDGKPGLGARLFVALDCRVPVIGVAKTKFHGDTWSQPIRRGGSEASLYVTGAGISSTDAARPIARMSGDARIPSFLKQADGLARAALS